MKEESCTYQLGRSLGEMVGGDLRIALTGSLGMGKTTLARGFIHGFLGDSSVTVNSPTFTYINSYVGSSLVQHVDLYRLSSARDFESIGGFEALSEASVSLIEWARQIKEVFEIVEVEIEFQDLSGGREVWIKKLKSTQTSEFFLKNFEEKKEEWGF